MATSKDIHSMQQHIKQLRYFYKVYKDGGKRLGSVVPLNGPCMILLRRNMNSEFYEATKKNKLKNAKFIYRHSNGEDRTVDLSDNYLYTGTYGDNKYKFYIHHEDSKYPIPMASSSIIHEYKQTSDEIAHSLSATLKWKAEEKKATAKQIMAVVALVGVVVLGFLGWILFKQPEPPAQNVIVMGEAVSSVPILLFWRKKWLK